MNTFVCEKYLQLELKKDIKDLTLINFIVFISLHCMILYVTSPRWRTRRPESQSGKADPFRDENYFDDSMKIIELLYKKENKIFYYNEIENYLYHLVSSQKESNIINGLYSLGFNRALSRESIDKVKKEGVIFLDEYLRFRGKK